MCGKSRHTSTSSVSNDEVLGQYALNIMHTSSYVQAVELAVSEIQESAGLKQTCLRKINQSCFRLHSTAHETRNASGTASSQSYAVDASARVAFNASPTHKTNVLDERHHAQEARILFGECIESSNLTLQHPNPLSPLARPMNAAADFDNQDEPQKQINSRAPAAGPPLLPPSLASPPAQPASR